MAADIVIPLIAVGLAEFGDKTQLSILLLSSKTRKHLELLLGVMLAFLIVDGFAVLVGSWVIGIVPLHILRIFSGVVFIVFGFFVLRDSKTCKDEEPCLRNPFLSGFLLVFMSEWGDKTQIAAGLFATKYNTVMVLFGTMTALMALSIMAVYIGKFISEKIDKKVITKIAGIAFILIGILFLLS